MKGMRVKRCLQYTICTKVFGDMCQKVTMGHQQEEKVATTYKSAIFPHEVIQNSTSIIDLCRAAGSQA